METETFVRDLFTQLAFCVERVSEVNDEERADYRVSDSRDGYVVEVKDKYDANSVLAAYRSTLEAGDVFLRSETTGYKNSFSNVFDKAERQLSATATSACDFRIVWLQLAGIDRELQFKQAMATIYGTVQLLPIGPTVVTKDCYYFNYNVVHRNPGIDAVILCDGESLILLTNPFSPRFIQLQSTSLYHRFADQRAVVDPVALEQAGDIYVADCSIPRTKSDAVLDYLQKKYIVERFLDLLPISYTAAEAVQTPAGDQATT